jgi:antitoxin VapB
MTLNIKDPETHKLARKLAEQTGETMTRAVTEALRERLARLNRAQKPEATADDLLAIGRRCAATLKGNPVDHGSLLYDERGLPK